MPFTDNFTGTADSLVSGRTGWTAGATGVDNAKINASNQVKFTDTGTDSKVVTHDTGAVDHYGQCVAQSAFGGPYFPIIARVTDRDNWYGIRLTGGLWEIWIANAGSLNRLTNVAGSVTAGDIIKFGVVGSTLTLYQNGSSILSVSDSTHSTEKLVGMYPRSSSTGDPVMDDWQSTDPSDSSVFVPYNPTQIRATIADQWEYD